jgi:hypothetical protein
MSLSRVLSMGPLTEAARFGVSPSRISQLRNGRFMPRHASDERRPVVAA